MGTINYGTSKIITVGLNPNNYEDLEGDNGVIIEGSRYELMDDMHQDIKALLEKADLPNEVFKVSIEAGYYEGFYINISDYFDDETDRNEALKELEKVFAFLNDSVDMGLSVCYPGWCTSYKDYMQSKEALAAAKTEALKIIDPARG